MKKSITFAIGLAGLFQRKPRWNRFNGRLTTSCVCVALLLFTLFGSHNSTVLAQQIFNFESIVRIARETAEQPYEDTSKQLPGFLLNMNYDQWRDIRFRKEKALWRQEGLPFNIEFFHPGFFFKLPVKINEVTDTQVNPVHFSRQLFTYGNNDFAERVPDDLGFAGFRIHYPLNRRDYYDEFAVFLGASYFRAVARGQVYGLSARGLAINTAAADGEEFPYFKEFWLIKPKSSADRLTLYALLESGSMTGAYQFILHPDQQTTIDVVLRLFPREVGKKIGLAPLTSMFFYSQTTNQRPVDDFRPEIHDSDGLLLAYPSGEFVWRPLINPQRLFINAFQMQNSSGFGLLQRDMVLDHYQDLEAHYHQRPSVWVQPVGEWGPGRVELVQIPTPNEKNDNIVAYWTPDQPISKAGSAIYQYKLSWYAFNQKRQHAGGYVVDTRTSAGRDKNHRRFLIDFKGGVLDQLPPNLPAGAPLEAVISMNEKAAVTEQQIVKMPNGAWRLIFEIQRTDAGTFDKILPDRDGGRPIEMRAFLKQGEHILTETWSYAVR